MNEYEEIFLKFIKSMGFDIQKIPEGDDRTPDFFIQKGSQRFIAEITEITPEEDFQFGKVYSRTPGKKLRAVISMFVPGFWASILSTCGDTSNAPDTFCSAASTASAKATIAFAQFGSVPDVGISIGVPEIVIVIAILV